MNTFTYEKDSVIEFFTERELRNFTNRLVILGYSFDYSEKICRKTKSVRLENVLDLNKSQPLVDFIESLCSIEQQEKNGIKRISFKTKTSNIITVFDSDRDYEIKRYDSSCLPEEVIYEEDERFFLFNENSFIRFINKSDYDNYKSILKSDGLIINEAWAMTKDRFFYDDKLIMKFPKRVKNIRYKLCDLLQNHKELLDSYQVTFFTSPFEKSDLPNEHFDFKSSETKKIKNTNLIFKVKIKRTKANKKVDELLSFIQAGSWSLPAVLGETNDSVLLPTLSPNQINKLIKMGRQVIDVEGEDMIITVHI